jgi:hypothetical protein
LTAARSKNLKGKIGDEMKFEEICKLDPMVFSLYQEATAFRVLSESGQRIRIWDAERAARLKPDPEFCRTQLFNALPRARGEVGLKHFLKQRVGYCAQVPELRNSHAYELCLFKFLEDMPHCNHAPDKLVACEDGGVVAESECSYGYPVPPGTCDRNAGKKGGFGSLLERMRNHDGRQLHETVNLDYLLSHPEPPEPEPVDLTPIDDLTEPVFLVRDKAAAEKLWRGLDFQQRLQERKISQWYVNNCIFYASEAECKEIVAEKLDVVTGILAWKPVVLTFKDEKLFSKLQSIGITVAMLDEVPDSLGKFRNALQFVSPPMKTGLKDMPEEVLDGWLGEICRTRMSSFPRAYAWPALVACAGALVNSKTRTNLYVALVGPSGSGKTQAIEWAYKLMGITEPTLLRLKAGSAEGLANRIGNVSGAHRLFFPDELLHTLEKAQIEGASFASFLNSAYDQDTEPLTIAKGKDIDFNCQLSMIGGLVDGKFGTAFGSKTTGGLYERFIFGQCPEGVVHLFRPFDGGPALETGNPFGETEDRLQANSERPISVTIDQSVYQQTDQWLKEEPELKRSVQNAVRVAVICAAFDKRPVLYGTDLGPALATARYQTAVRKLLQPNEGENPQGILTHQFLSHLERMAPDGRTVGEREMLNSTNAYRFGPGIAEQVLRALEFNGDIERIKIGRKRFLRKPLD